MYVKDSLGTLFNRTNLSKMALLITVITEAPLATFGIGGGSLQLY
jgi:hypothetical protein